MLGKFDGEKFTPETPILKGHRGKGFYAAQTFSDIPATDGRRIQIGWLQAPSPGMPFNQCMSLPLELILLSTTDGPRLSWTPLPLKRQSGEPQSLRLLHPGRGILAENNAGVLQMQAKFEPGPNSEVKLDINGVPVIYSAEKQEISVNGHRASAPLREGKQHLTIITDRTTIEVFASDGLVYVPMPVLQKEDARAVAISTSGAPLKSSSFSVTELR